jgi:hypothetical protein
MMCNFVARRLAPVVAVVLLASVPAVATTVMQMNLVEMAQRSAQIYRGTVLSATEGTVKIGGGQLPVVTYRLQVEESFRGDIPVVKGMRVAEIQMIGKSSPVRKGTLVRASVLPQMPALAVGRTYVVFTTQPSTLGLSAIVGLGQGAFRIDHVGKQELAVNEVNNSGLFRDMAAPASRSARSLAAPAASVGASGAGPIPYNELASQIRNAVGRF